VTQEDSVVANNTPPLRIGHAERDRAIALLQEHTTAGRLELDEFEERIEQVSRARTTADLDAVLADLPSLEPDTAGKPYAAAFGPPLAWRPRPRPRRVALPGWLQLSLLMVGIWAISGFGYFWPAWVIVPTVLCSFGSCGNRRRHHPRPEHHHISA
jgi:hypothetical protein